jgi:site-specific recombinase XerC
LNAFNRHLASERGCAAGTRVNYLREARSFLVFAFPDLRTNWEALNADQVAGFVLRRAEDLSKLSQQGPVTAIRRLLRFLTFEGKIRAGLEGAVPPLRGSRHASIARHLSPEQLDCERCGVPPVIRPKPYLYTSAEIAACPTPHDGNALAAIRGRHNRNRPLAGP